MAAAGAETLVVGIEHFSEPIRDHMKKHFDDDSIDFHFEMCGKYGIKNVLLMISGYVTETEQDHKNNLLGLEKYQKYALARIIYAINIGVNGLSILPFTPLSDMINELDIQYLGNDEKNDWVSGINPGLTRMERLKRAAEVVYYATKLGYRILHLQTKIKEIEVYIEQIKNNQPIIPILVAQPEQMHI